MIRSFVPTQRNGVVEICGDNLSYLQKTRHGTKMLAEDNLEASHPWASVLSNGEE